ncbi:ABC transporter substrate-binding protein [Paenibacillus psychroresistens]|nr:extracellular solute-binding protein [Paenibacillus psychroresistens]
MRKGKLRFGARLMVLAMVMSVILSACSSKSASDDKAAAKETEHAATAAATATAATTATPEVTEAPKAKDKVKLTFAYNWTGTDAKAEIYEGLLKKYMEEHKDTVDITLEATPGDEHKTKMKIEIASGNQPDLFMYYNGDAYIKPLVDGKVIVSAEEYMAVSKAVKKEQWTDSAWDSFKLGDQHYGFPVESFKGFFMYNKTIFDKYKLTVPTTYAELKVVSKVLRDNGIIPLAMSSKGGNPGHLFFDQIRDQFPDGIADAQNLGTSFKFDSPSAITTANIIDDMRKNKMFPDDTIANGDWGPSITTYNEGKAAMIYSFPWMIGTFKPEIGAVSEMAAFPKMDNATVDPAGFTIGGVSMGLVVSRKPFEDMAKQAELVKFSDFLVSDEMFSALGKASMTPAKDLKLAVTDLNPLFVKFVDFAGKQGMYPPVYNWFPTPDSAAEYFSQLDSLFAGAVKPDAFISSIQKSVAKAKK